MIYCSQKGQLEIVKYLIEKGKCVYANDIYLALKWSAINGHLEVVKYLIEFGTNIHQENDYALRYSAKKAI